MKLNSVCFLSRNIRRGNLFIQSWVSLLDDDDDEWGGAEVMRRVILKISENKYRNIVGWIPQQVVGYSCCPFLVDLTFMSLIVLPKYICSGVHIIYVCITIIYLLIHFKYCSNYLEVRNPTRFSLNIVCYKKRFPDLFLLYNDYSIRQRD